MIQYFIFSFFLILSLNAETQITQTQIVDQRNFQSCHIPILSPLKLPSAYWHLGEPSLKLCAGIASATFLTLFGYVFFIEHAIKRHVWGRWHEDVSLEALRQISEEDIVQELMQQQNRNLSTESLFSILQEIEREYALLKRYKRFQTFKIFTFLPYQRTMHHEVQEQMHRLDFLKQTIFNALPIAV